MNANRTVPALGIACILLGFLALLVLGCAPRAYRGGEGTGNPDIDRAAMSVGLDRDDITFMVDGYLSKLEASAFWQQSVKTSSKPPIVAIWPIRNATTQHLDDQMLMLLSSIETSLVNTNSVRVVDRSRQEELAREIGIQQGAIYDPASAQRLGRQLGAQYFVTGKVTGNDEKLNKERRVQYSLFLQVLEIETGLIRFQDQIDRTKIIKR